jgi:hypothetical protein
MRTARGATLKLTGRPSGCPRVDAWGPAGRREARGPTPARTRTTRCRIRATRYAFTRRPRTEGPTRSANQQGETSGAEPGRRRRPDRERRVRAAELAAGRPGCEAPAAGRATESGLAVAVVEWRRFRRRTTPVRCPTRERRGRGPRRSCSVGDGPSPTCQRLRAAGWLARHPGAARRPWPELRCGLIARRRWPARTPPSRRGSGR